ncbi:DNA methyl transferase1 [Zea mays]|uniref:DNA methyl transferase1 n=1 Tax=Zea mays TaxID=4577 RepID=A0A1D6HU23_MAIZE|nr:DNA methyl transferase1 [Zea mays]
MLLHCRSSRFLRGGFLFFPINCLLRQYPSTNCLQLVIFFFILVGICTLPCFLKLLSCFSDFCCAV